MPRIALEDDHEPGGVNPLADAAAEPGDLEIENDHGNECNAHELDHGEASDDEGNDEVQGLLRELEEDADSDATDDSQNSSMSQLASLSHQGRLESQRVQQRHQRWSQGLQAIHLAVTVKTSRPLGSGPKHFQIICSTTKATGPRAQQRTQQQQQRRSPRVQRCSQRICCLILVWRRRWLK